MKKLISILAIAVMALAMGVTVYGDEYSYNEKVEYLVVNGINYNATYETESVDGVTYDAVNNILTIENCNITTDGDFINYKGSIPLNIVVKGNNTINGTEKENSYQDYFCYSNACSSEDGSADDSINITGNGILNVNNFYNLVSRGVYDYAGVLSIDGVTINTNGAGIRSPYGNIIIKNSKIKINDSTSKSSYGTGISTGEPDEGADLDGNGKITIQNSIVEMKTASEAGLLWCKQLDLPGEYIYAGKQSAEYSYTPNELLVYDSIYKCSYSLYDIRYILITTEKLNYPSVSVKNNTTNNNATNNNNNVETTTAKITKPSVQQTTKVKKPGAVKSFKVKNVKGKKAKLSWKKMSGIGGYQIVYGLNKKCTKGKKTVTASSTSKNKTIKKLKKKKTYYFKIRAYKVSGGSKVYGAWSAVKKVKIKK